jgi:hypothetical protein
MGNLYSIYQSQTAPGMLQRPNGKIIESIYGAEKDVEFERARQGMLVNLPGIAPADAVPYIGSERQLPQAVGESVGDWAERCRTVWDATSGWSFAGGDWSILQALQRAGFPMGTATGVNIVHRYQEYSYLASGVLTRGTHAPYNFDSSAPWLFNQFMVVIGADFTPPIGSSFATGDPSVNLFNDLVDQWKPSKWRYMGAGVIISGPTWGWPPTDKWGTGGGGSGLVWGGGSTRFVSPSL